MKITGKAYQEQYKTQDERGEFDVPPTGTYHVVNVALQRTRFKTGSECVKVFSAVLAVVDSEEPAVAKTWIGKKFSSNLWWDLSKPGNAARAACMATACGMSPSEEWDSENDSSCVAALTGVPYILKMRRRVESYEGKERKSVDVFATLVLSKEQRKTYASAPDWTKITGAPSERMLPLNDLSAGKASAAGKQTSIDTTATTDPFSGDEIPL